MNSVLNRLIPGSGEMPGAGEVGVGEYLDSVIGSSPTLARLFGDGLAQIDIASQQRYSNSFEALEDIEKDSVLKQVESVMSGFFDLLVRHSYNGYYTAPQVIELLGLNSSPVQPRGYQLDAGDLSSLEDVKKRGRIYREV